MGRISLVCFFVWSYDESASRIAAAAEFELVAISHGTLGRHGIANEAPSLLLVDAGGADKLGDDVFALFYELAIVRKSAAAASAAYLGIRARG